MVYPPDIQPKTKDIKKKKNPKLRKLKKKKLLTKYPYEPLVETREKMGFCPYFI